MTPQGKVPFRRRFHAMAKIGNCVYIYGGRNDTTQFDDLIKIVVGPLSLHKLCMEYIATHYDVYKDNKELPQSVKDKIEKKKIKKQKEEKEDEEEDDEDIVFTF